MSSTAQNTIYKCQQPNGTVEFSQSPCGKNAEVKAIDSRSQYERDDDAKKVWKIAGAPTASQANACVDAWRRSLKDPDSGRLQSDSSPGIYVTTGKRKVSVSEGRARNGFGGFNVQYFLCDVTGSGEIIGDGNPYGDLRSKAEEIEKYPSLGMSLAFPGIQ